MSEVNIDTALVRGREAALSWTEERLVEMTNGCVCCTLPDDLLDEVDRLAREGRFDHLLIESSGISEPMPVAATFAFARDDGATLDDVALLDTMVTVVDAASFLAGLESGDDLAERGLAPYVLGTRLFDLERAQQAPGWVRELNGDHVPETEEYGISSTVFRSELPFHPALTDCLMAPGEPVPADDPFPAWDTYGIDEACEHEHDGAVSAV